MKQVQVLSTICNLTTLSGIAGDRKTRNILSSFPKITFDIAFYHEGGQEKTTYVCLHSAQRFAHTCAVQVFETATTQRRGRLRAAASLGYDRG
jgi:hypothetical protein